MINVSDTTKTKEIWNQLHDDPEMGKKLTLGLINSHSMLNDPKHFCFTLSRYKFAAKMLKDRKKIVDIGCGEGIGCLMLKSETNACITGIDFDSVQIKYAKENIEPLRDIEYICKDVIKEKIGIDKVDGIVSIDVIEHLCPEDEELFFKNITSCLTDDVVAIFGTPTVHSKQYMSKRSKIGHINLFDEERLRNTLLKYFNYVFIFSMNDEMVHTGFPEMAHYFMALCCR